MSVIYAEFYVKKKAKTPIKEVVDTISKKHEELSAHADCLIEMGFKQSNLSSYKEYLKDKVDKIKDGSYMFEDMISDYLIYLGKGNFELDCIGTVYESIDRDEHYEYRKFFRLHEYSAEVLRSFADFDKFYQENKELIISPLTKNGLYEVVKHFFKTYADDDCYIKFG